MDLEIDTYSSCIIKNTPYNIKKISNKLLEGGLIIYPDECNFELGCDGLNENAIEHLYSIKKKCFNEPIKLNCLGFNDILPLVNLTEKETELFKLIVENVWPGPLSILLRANTEIIPKKLVNKNGYTCFNSPKHPLIRKLIQFVSSPIASSGANISSEIKSTCLEHVLNYFGDIKIDIFDDNYICKYGYETTLIKINNSKIDFIRRGPILLDNLKDIISSHNFDIEYNCVEINKNIKYKKKIFTFNIIDLENIKINQSIIDNYLDNTFLIDFNKLCLKYKKKFLGYVDLSEEGDSIEGLFNLYNVLHQIDKIECNQIFIYDFSFIEDDSNNLLWDKCLKMSQKCLSIPICFIN